MEKTLSWSTVVVQLLFIAIPFAYAQGNFPPASLGVNLAEDKPAIVTSFCNSSFCEPSLLNDGNQNTYWRSDTGVSDVNVTIDLKEERRIIYASIHFESSIPLAIVIYYSTDGITFSPRQYYARNCSDLFDLSPNLALQSISDVNCISNSKFHYPFKDQLVEFVLIGSGTRPNADTVAQLNLQPELQEFAQASHVMIQLFGWHPEQPDNDRYFAITEVTLSGQACICNGHASMCSDTVNGVCMCEHNTAGDNCEQCLPLYNDQEWQAGTVNLANPCIECECHNHSSSCLYNGTLDQGVCVDCQYQTSGLNCEECTPFYYHPSTISIDSINRCQPCDCNPLGIIDDGDCLRSDNPDGTDSGNCSCKNNVGGRNCSFCLDSFYGINNPDGCISCGCNTTGSLSNICDKDTGQCECVYGIGGRDCSQCAEGFYGSNPNGCVSCGCNMKGSLSNICDKDTGQCECAYGVIGRDCSQCMEGFYGGKSNGCISCGCNMKGSLSKICDKDTGHCKCAYGVIGRDCSQCAEGFCEYGSEVEGGCQKCHEECVNCYESSDTQCTVSTRRTIMLIIVCILLSIMCNV